MTLDLYDGFLEVGRAIRRPETLAERWRDRALLPEDAPPLGVFVALTLTAILGLAAYGLTMGMHHGAAGMLAAAGKAPLAAGAGWSIALPSLYIVKQKLGSRLDASTTALAALITCSFGALAMLAGAPVSWFFTVAVPVSFVRYLVNFIIFAGVGVAMTDVFLRIMKHIAPEESRATAFLWLALVGTLGAELMVLLNLFNF